MNTNQVLDYEKLLETSVLRAQAEHGFALAVDSWWRLIALDLFSRNQDRDGLKLRASDAGGCTLEKWADLHGKLDIADNWRSLLLKMEQGTVSGARIACYLAAALEEFGLRVDVEPELSHGGVSGHADLIIYDRDVAVEVIECKWSASLKPVEDLRSDREFHGIQAAKYALAKGAPLFTVIETHPAAKGGVVKFFREETADWITAVDYEYGERLAVSLLDVAPEPDVPQSFSCTYCRYSACFRNRNSMRQVS